MELIIEPPKTILYIVLGIIIVIVAGMLLKKGDAKKKLLSLVVAVVAVVVILFVMYRKGAIIVDENGIRSTTFGNIDITWDEVQQADYIPDFVSTEYGIKTKISGIGIGELKAGCFLLKNGKSAKIIVQQNNDALLLTSRQGDLVLLAPDDLDSLVSETGKYIDIENHRE